MKLVLLGLGLFLRVVAWEEMAHAELPALRGGMDDAWPIQDQDDFTQHPAYILERQVKDEVLRLKDRRAYRQAYHNFLQNLSAHLTAQNIAHRIVETANEPTEGLRYHQLIITPNAASPINILAQRLAAHHLTLAYAGMRDIYNHRFPKKHTMLVPYLVRREVYLNATTLFNQAKILEHPDTVALFKFIELMEQNKLAYLQGSCLLQVGEFYLPSSKDPQQPALSVMLDKKDNIFISRIPASRIHFISLYSSAVALAQQAAVAGQQLQIAGKIDEALIRDIFNQYHRLRLRVASRLSNLNAMTYTILHHPLWVRWKWGTDDAEGFIHLTAKPLATTYPNFYFSLKFLWPAASLPPDTTALLAHHYWQGIYRFMQQLYLALQDLASSVDQLADLPLAQQIKWLAQMQDLATLAERVEGEVATEPWPAARFAAQFAEVQPVILQLLNEHERQKNSLATRPLPLTATPSPPAHPLLQEEQSYQQQIKNADGKKQGRLYRQWLSRLRNFLQTRKIAHVYDSQNLRINISPGPQTRLNRWAAELQRWGLDLSYICLNKFKDNYSYQAQAILGRYPYLELQVTALAFLDEEILRPLRKDNRKGVERTEFWDLPAVKALEQAQKTFAQQPVLPLWHRPTFIVQGRHLLAQAPQAQGPADNVNVVLDNQLPIKIFAYSDQKPLMNYSLMYVYLKLLNLNALGEDFARTLKRYHSFAVDQIKFLFATFDRTRLMIAPLLLDLHAMLYTMLHHPERTKVIFGGAQEIKVEVTPEPSIPKFKYVLQLPWVYGEAYPKNASDILASRSWQEIYRFMQQANQILSASVLFFNYFDRINDISRLKQFATWERLVKLPLELQEEIAQGKLWHMADYMQVLRQDQAKLIRLVERNLGHHRSLTQRPGKVPAQNCQTNLLP